MKEDSEWTRELIPGFLQNMQSHIRTYCRPWIFNIDTKNGGLEKLTPLKSGSFGVSMYPCQISRGVSGL